MRFAIDTFTVHKRFPLTISRGTTAQTTNIWLRILEDGIEGYGEASPFSVVGGKALRHQKQNTDELLRQLEQIIPTLERFHPCQRQSIEETVKQAEVSSSAQAAIDMALYDWLGKKVGLPLWRLWGLNRSRIVPTSVTVGISSEETAQTRVRQWQQLTEVKVIKVKMGSGEGIEADRAMLLAVKEAAPHAQLMVDANGGWSLDDAIKMCQWLAGQGIKYVEQPLAVGEEKNLFVLSEKSPLPIFVDESCFTSRDVPPLANWVNGINIKIMKAGGLTEAIRTIHTAKACRLQVMFGCYSDSTLANTAMAHLSPLADYLDLDSHLNLRDDPFTGATMEAGRLLPNDLPGLGVEYGVSDG
jgi:L-alanine-DL-glutamate epimerase-like enolase superfamily enzyme